MTHSEPMHSTVQCLDRLDPEFESFSRFFETWLQEQNRDLQNLISAAKSYPDSTRSGADSTRPVSHLVDRVKSDSEKRNALEMLTPSWRSTLEEAFLWIGGWRPTMAIHLLYSKSGLQLESGLSDLLNGLSTGDLADLTQNQLARVDELHQQTVKEEKQLTEKMAAFQETVADSSMVELSHAVTELMNSGAATESKDVEVEAALVSKEKKMMEIMESADDLRLRTLKNVVGILTTIQAVHFLIAAAELHLRVHEWGKKKDAQARGAL